LCGVYFCTLCPSIGPKEKSRQVLGRLPLVSNFLTNFWIQHFDGARLSPNSVRNAVWHALNEPVCQYLRTRNPRCSTIHIPLTRHSSHNYRDAAMCNTGKCKSLDQSKSRGGPCCFPPLPVCVYCINFLLGLKHNRTTQRRYTPRDSSRQHRHFGKSIPEFAEKNAFKCAWM